MAVSAESLEILLKLQGVPTYTAGMKEASGANKEFAASSKQSAAASDQAAAASERQRGANALASKALKATGLVVAAAAFESVKAAVKWESMGKAVQQQTGLTGKSLDSLMNVIQAAANNSPYAINEIAEAAVLLRTKFGMTDSQIEKTSSLMVAFAQRAGGTAKDVSTSVLSIMQAFREPMGHLTTLTDELTSVTQATQKPMGDLLGVVEKFAPKLQAMGFGLQSTIQLLGVFQASGISTSMMGRGLATALTKAEKEHKETNVPIPDIIKKHMEEITKAKSQQEAYSIAMEFFGKQVGPSFARALYNNVSAFHTVDKAMEKTGATQGLVNAANETAEGKWNKLKNNMFGVAHEAGGPLVGALTLVFKGLIAVEKGLAAVTDKGKLLSPIVAGLIAMWIAYRAYVLAARAATVAWAIATTAAAAVSGGAETAVLALMYAFDALDVAMLANPIGLIVIAIAAVIAAIVLLIMHFNAIKNWVIKNWPLVAAALIAPWALLPVFVATHFGLVKGLVSGAVKGIQSAWGAVTKFLTAPFDYMWAKAVWVFKQIENLWKKIPGHGLVEKAVGIGGNVVSAGAKFLGFAEGGVMPYSGYATVNEGAMGETIWLPGGATVQPSPASALGQPRAHTPTPAPMNNMTPIYIDAVFELPRAAGRSIYKVITKEATIKEARK